jgi:hypothetical protein
VGLNTSDDFYQSFVANSERYSSEARACIERTVERLCDVETTAGKPGMLLGKIQSGKTRTFLGIIALAFANEFDIAVILTKGTKALAKQTLHRVRDEFAPLIDCDGAQIYDIMTVPAGLTGWELSQKLVFVAKKQSDNLDRLDGLIRETYPQLARRRALIIDDEADYASVGFRNKQSDGIQANVTTQQIDMLRGLFKASAFLQVTATPYSLYLQPDDYEAHGLEYRPLRPAFTELVPVASSYIGSDFYFDESQAPDTVAARLFHEVSTDELTVLKHPDRRRFKVEECLTSKAIPALRAAVCNFVVGGVIRRLQSARAGLPAAKFSFLVHTEAAQASHAWQEDVVTNLRDALARAATNDVAGLRGLLAVAYDDLAVSISLMKHDLPSKEEVLEQAVTALKSEWLMMITKVNSERQVEELLDDEGQLRLRTPLNLFIGGQILDRGITVANLIGFFYGRRPTVYQQDTVLQHSRMFGFRPMEDLTVTRFYTAHRIYQAMRRMHESDVALRHEVETSPDSPVVFIQCDAAGQVVSCSPNKTLLSRTTTLRPFKRLLPVGFQTDAGVRTRPVIKEVDKRLEAIFQGNFEAPVRVTLSVAVELLRRISPTLIMEKDYEFDWPGTAAALEYLSNAARNPDNRGRVLLLVRKDRDLSREITSGGRKSFSDAPDTAQREGVIARSYAKDIPMLMLFRQNGEEAKGWRGTPFYWPVIWAPENARTAVFSHTTGSFPGWGHGGG